MEARTTVERGLVPVAGGAAQAGLRLYFAGGMFAPPKQLSDPASYEFKVVGPSHGVPYVVCRSNPPLSVGQDDPEILFDLVKHHAHLYEVDLEGGRAVVARRSTQCDAAIPVRAPDAVDLPDGLVAMLRMGWAETRERLGIEEGGAPRRSRLRSGM
jgi:hypothetical protein